MINILVLNNADSSPKGMKGKEAEKILGKIRALDLLYFRAINIFVFFANISFAYFS